MWFDKEGRAIGCGILSVAMIASCAVGGVIGGLWNSTAMYHGQFQQERDLIAPVLASDPAFARVEVHEKSNGGIFLTGTVPTQSDLGRLRVKLIRVFGEPKPSSF